MACFVYIIGSKNKSQLGKLSSFRTYVGWSNDPEKRLKSHNSGVGAKSTRGRQWILLYTERYNNRSEAMSREWYLKRDRRFRKTVADSMSSG